MIDLLVAGAGPAGLFTALYARAAGMTVLVIDPRSSPIDKACGEGLMPGAVALLADLGLHPGADVPGRAYHGIRYLAGDRTVEARFRAATGWGVRRDALQASMYNLAVRSGVRFETARVTSVRQRPDRVVADGREARYLAAADGLHSPIRRGLGLQAPATNPPRWGLRRHYAAPPWTDLVEVHWSAAGEAYVTPTGADEVSVALLTSRPGTFDSRLADFPRLAALLATGGATVAGPVRGAGPLRQRVRARVAGRVLLVGDAAGYVDALTGQGIEVAGRTAAALVECLAADRPADYEHHWRRLTRRYRLATGTLLAARRREPTRRALLAAAVSCPPLFDLAVRQAIR